MIQHNLGTLPGCFVVEGKYIYRDAAVHLSRATLKLIKLNCVYKYQFTHKTNLDLCNTAKNVSTPEMIAWDSVSSITLVGTSPVLTCICKPPYMTITLRHPSSKARFVSSTTTLLRAFTTTSSDEPQFPPPA